MIIEFKENVENEWIEKEKLWIYTTYPPDWNQIPF